MFVMNSFKDYRTELLLLIPGIFILFQLLHSSTGEIFNREVATSEHFDITKVNVSPDFQDQANVLLSVFLLEDIPVNQASAELLATIPGIGPALAKRISNPPNFSSQDFKADFNLSISVTSPTKYST